MVDAQGIKILLHVLHALLEPSNQFFTPAISRESPVMSLWRKGIWRGTCQGIEIEQLWMLLYLNAVTIYANGQVAFQDNTLFSSIVCSIFQLGMK